MMDVTKGHIITFYSYKGGTGRSMALANFAWILACNGKKVLAIDWDLEAPGLHRYFRPFLVDPDLLETEGLIDCFWRFGSVVATGNYSQANRSVSADEAAPLDAVETVIDDVVQRLNYSFGKGCLDFLCAGRQDGAYSEKVSSFKWAHFYDLGGAAIIRQIKDLLRLRYDYVLVDSRTGVSDTAGVCTIQMPDSVVACFTMNRQSIEGVTAILRSIRSHRSESVDGSIITLYPTAMRIENAERDRLEAARSYARSLLNGFLPRNAHGDPRTYWDVMEIAYRPAYAFEEVLAAFGDSTGSAGAADTMLAQMEAMARLLGDDSKLTAPQIVESDRREVISKYHFEVEIDGRSSTEVIDDEKTRGLSILDKENDSDEKFLRDIYKKETLWRSTGYSWRNLLNSREVSMITEKDKMEFGRGVSFFYNQSVIMKKMVEKIDEIRVYMIMMFLAYLAVLFIIDFFVKKSAYFMDISRYDIENFMIMIFLLSLIFPSYLVMKVLYAERPFGVSRNDIIKIFISGNLASKYFR